MNPELRPLADVARGFAADGYTAAFEVTDDAALACDACAETHDPEDFRMDRLGRYEGTSDPDDMQALMALTCPCGCQGTLTTPYGANADGTTGDVLRRLPDARER